MTDETRPDTDLAATIAEVLPPASQSRGEPGHDSATEVARGARLLRLRAARMTYEQIATELGYADKAAARNALMRALARHEAENVTELRALENLALDADERVLRAMITDANVPAATRLRAIDSRTRLSARRSRLNGLDAPIQVALSAGVQADLEDALAEAEAVLVRGEVIHPPDPDDDPGSAGALVPRTPLTDPPHDTISLEA